MIEVGELKVGDRVLDKFNNKFGTVIDIEYNRLIDDESELITFEHDGLKTLALIRTPIEEDFIEKLKNKKKKNKGDKEMKTSKYEVILNDPAVILFVNEIDPYRQRKYVSKAHNEPFDPEKGLLMCLAKANGISHLDLKRMIKNAKNQKKSPVIEKFNKLSKEIETIKQSTTNKENSVVSPKGKKRGQPYKFFAGDKVIVRDCDYYKYTTNANAKQLLNKVLEIGQDNSDFAGSVYIVNGFEFSGSELEPIK